MDGEVGGKMGNVEGYGRHCLVGNRGGREREDESGVGDGLVVVYRESSWNYVGLL